MGRVTAGAGRIVEQAAGAGRQAAPLVVSNPHITVCSREGEASTYTIHTVEQTTYRYCCLEWCPKARLLRGRDCGYRRDQLSMAG